ncbi:hypothetical protein [Saccharopolyspora gregorii]|uniref:hypothetical protein n=1 Tax=Saccharopolyspora gregorii TaxID=33914 RepID=UPI003CD0596E
MRHVEVDLTDHPEWSTPLRVHRTPTTLALDAAGRELFGSAACPAATSSPPRCARTCHDRPDAGKPGGRRVRRSPPHRPTRAPHRR